jgi:hypothetical protein
VSAPLAGTARARPRSAGRPVAERPTGAYAVEARVEVRPPWVFRLGRMNSMDGLHRVRGGVMHRLLHRGGAPVWVRIAQPAPDRVLFGARAADRGLAEWGIERMRLATGVDQDLAPFYERFRDDPLIGPSVRRSPGLRVAGRPDPFEALAWAVCEQLIEYERGVAIERRLIARRAPLRGVGSRRLPDGGRDRGPGTRAARLVRPLGGPGARARARRA